MFRSIARMPGKALLATARFIRSLAVFAFIATVAAVIAIATLIGSARASQQPTRIPPSFCAAWTAFGNRPSYTNLTAARLLAMNSTTPAATRSDYFAFQYALLHGMPRMAVRANSRRVFRDCGIG